MSSGLLVIGLILLIVGIVFLILPAVLSWPWWVYLIAGITAVVGFLLLLFGLMSGRKNHETVTRETVTAPTQRVSTVQVPAVRTPY